MKGDQRWITKYTVPELAINNLEQVINFPQLRKDNLTHNLEAIPKKVDRVSKQKCFCLFGILKISPRNSGSVRDVWSDPSRNKNHIGMAHYTKNTSSQLTEPLATRNRLYVREACTCKEYAYDTLEMYSTQ